MKKPNIIFIILDGARAKSLSCYDNKRLTSPNLDAFAKEAVIYRYAFACAQTSNPCYASLLTGLYPSEHGTHGSQLFFKKNEGNLADILKRNFGYQTIFINSSNLLSDFFGFSLCFENLYQTWQLVQKRSRDDIFFDRSFINLLENKKYFSSLKYFLRNAKIRKNTVSSLVNYLYANKFRNIHRNSAFATRRTIKIAIDYLRKSKKKPIFLFLNLLEAHDMYNPPREIRKLFSIDLSLKQSDPNDYYLGKLKLSVEDFKKQLELYEASIFFQDQELGKLLRYLKRNPEYDDSLIIITADHGEHIGEKGHFTHLFTLYNELIHVPLIIKYPNLLAKMGECKDIVQTHDIFATILDMLGQKTNNNSFPLLTPRRRKFAFSELVGSKYAIKEIQMHDKQFNDKEFSYRRCLFSAIREDGYKYIYSTDGNNELYNIFEDYAEEKNLLKCSGFDLVGQEIISAVKQEKLRWEEEVKRNSI